MARDGWNGMQATRAKLTVSTRSAHARVVARVSPCSSPDELLESDALGMFTRSQLACIRATREPKCTTTSRWSQLNNGVCLHTLPDAKTRTSPDGALELADAGCQLRVAGRHPLLDAVELSLQAVDLFGSARPHIVRLDGSNLGSACRTQQQVCGQLRGKLHVPATPVTTYARARPSRRHPKSDSGRAWSASPSRLTSAHSREAGGPSNRAAHRPGLRIEPHDLAAFGRGPSKRWYLLIPRQVALVCPFAELPLLCHAPVEGCSRL